MCVCVSVTCLDMHLYCQEDRNKRRRRRTKDERAGTKGNKDKAGKLAALSTRRLVKHSSSCIQLPCNTHTHTHTMCCALLFPLPSDSPFAYSAWHVCECLCVFMSSSLRCCLPSFVAVAGAAAVANSASCHKKLSKCLHCVCACVCVCNKKLLKQM